MISAVAVAFLLSAINVSAERGLSLKVSAPASINDIDNLVVKATLSNTGDETLKILNDPRSPLSKWATNSWDIWSSEAPSPKFTGVKVRYSPEAAIKAGRPEDFTILAPGASIEIDHDLAGAYNFTEAGNYNFMVANLFSVVEDNGKISTVFAETGKTAVSIQGKLASSKHHAGDALNLSKRASYRSCSSTRQSQTAAAISSASSLASSSASHLSSNPSGSTRYTRWFGTFSSSRHSAALNSFNRLVSAPSGWTYDCTCTDAGTYAYVYPSSYGVVYLCGAFWTAPATGPSSRADTIIHEGTHFTQILGTDDYAYGQSACLSLAKSNPTNAVYNADNHAFFSVNA